ncbi:MAG: hypothetical protein V4671_17620, partial [Armatimonadota bacterium]
MHTSRCAIFTILTLAVMSRSDLCREVRAQTGSVTTQNILPDGTVITNSNAVSAGQNANNRVAPPLN